MDEWVINESHEGDSKVPIWKGRATKYFHILGYWPEPKIFKKSVRIKPINNHRFTSSIIDRPYLQLE